MKKAAILWYQARWGRVVCAVLAAVGAYIVASLAIDSGSLLQYFIAIVLVILSLRYAFWAIKG